MITISGELTYRQRIALIPGGTAIVRLLDTSRQEAKASEVATTTIELGDRQVPIAFVVSANTSELDPRATYSVRATITGPDGNRQWTTDTANPVNIVESEVDLGSLMLVQVAGSGGSSSQPTAPGATT